MTPRKLFAMCGLSFSGKTTLARAVARLVGAEYVSLDDINEERGLRGGEGIPVEEWERTSALAIERIGRLFDAGRDVVLDDTLCFRWLRERYAAVADRHGAMFVLIYVSTPLPEIYRAMAENDAVLQREPIHPGVFEAHARYFEHPTEEERPRVYDRTMPVEEWIASHLLQGAPPARGETRERMNRYVVVSGIPASGKSTLAKVLSSALGLPWLDKDHFLEALFESKGIGDARWRRQLSHEADASLRERAERSAGAVLTSWWKHPQSSSDTGTPVDWLYALPGAKVEAHCLCTAEVAAERFLARKRHPGHLDHRWSYPELVASFRTQASLGPLRLGALVEVNTEGELDVPALLARIGSALEESGRSGPLSFH